MKLIIAIIQPSKLESVKAALTEVEVFRLTVMLFLESTSILSR